MAREPGTGDVIATIKNRLDIVEVIGERIRLIPRGGQRVALCPFHSEKTPSFNVNPVRQSFYCFGCQAHGDIFEFVQRYEHTDFRGALEILAQRAGVELETGGRGADREQAALRKRVIEINQLAADYYHYVLVKHEQGAPGRDLLDRRGVSAATAAAFGLGYAPAGSNLLRYLASRGVSASEVARARLSGHDGRDFFQERLVIPIRDESGRTVAFTGRTLRADEPRKYVNSPETAAFSKSRTLFGLDRARAEIAKVGRAVLVEGQFDVISAHQAGLTIAVASSGTALTEDQVRLLRRWAEELVLAMDDDAAGRRAVFRAVEIADREGLRTRVVTLPGAKDPDEWFQALGAEAMTRWEELVAAAPAGWEYWIKDCLSGLNLGRLNDVQIGLTRVREVLVRIADPALRSRYEKEAGRMLGVDVAGGVDRRRVRGRPVPAGTDRSPVAAADPGRAPASARELRPAPSPARYLLRLLAVQPELIPIAVAEVDPGDLDDFERGLLGRLQAAAAGPIDPALPGFTDEEREFVHRAWASPLPVRGEPELRDAMAKVRETARRGRMRAIEAELREAERLGDTDRVDRLYKLLSDLARVPGAGTD